MQHETAAVQNDAARNGLPQNQRRRTRRKHRRQAPAAFVTLVQAGKDLVDWLSQLSDGTIKSALYIGVFAAAIGPTITLVAELAAGTMKLYEAMKLLASGEALEKIVAISPIPRCSLALPSSRPPCTVSRRRGSTSTPKRRPSSRRSISARWRTSRR
jgi:hypothetical protein